jgi:DNA-binding response OmpR family regulator
MQINSLEDVTMFKILIVEDDRDLNRSLCSFLNGNGYEAVGCLDGESAYDEMYKTTFDCIVSDIMLPASGGRQIDGFELAATIRTLNRDIPILFVTAREDFASKQRGFQLGIDDYMVKPIDLDELLLRLGAILRRSRIAASRRLEVGNFVMDADERSATLNGEEISLTAREFDLLYKLLSYPKKTFTRTQLMDEFWDVDTQTSTRTVDVYMTKLRAKLAGCDSFEIQTVHGLGYKAVIK